MPITYSVRPATQEGQEDEIVAVGQERVFKMSDLQSEIVQLKKFIKEVTAKVELEEAAMENIRHFHPEVEQLAPQKRTAVALFTTSEGTVNICKAKLEEMNKQLDECVADLAEIEKQTGKKLETDVVSQSV